MNLLAVILGVVGIALFVVGVFRLGFEEGYRRGWMQRHYGGKPWPTRRKR